MTSARLRRSYRDKRCSGQSRRARHRQGDEYGVPVLSLGLSPAAIYRILDCIMADLLVKLYDLPREKCAVPEDVEIRRAFAAEKRLVAQWVAGNFGERWASECEISFMRSPVACFIATNRLDVLGFASYDATARGFFGPTGVAV